MKMVKVVLGYEEVRKKRVEENKKRMEELKLPHLFRSLKQHNNSSPKHSPMKRTGPRSVCKEVVEVRRSNRVAKIPAKEYIEAVTYERFEFERRIFKRSGTRDFSSRVYASDKERAIATLKAEEVELSLGEEYPTFVKPMTQSHVTGGFWLGLPSHFCRKNLPKRDETVTLIDEKGEEFPTVYLARKAGLSGGWRGFSIDHGLVDGDALVFQLIQPTVFKVYIIRAYSSEESDDLRNSQMLEPKVLLGVLSTMSN